MKNAWKKRLLAMLLSAVMMIGLTACGGGGVTDAGGGSADGKLFTEDTVIKWVVPDHASWPYNEDWVVWNNFEQEVGATFDITAIPFDNYSTKLNLMMAEGQAQLPDLIASPGRNYPNQFAPTGALIAIDDYIDMMPNYTAFWNSLPEDERESRLMMRKYADGKTYYPQVYGTEKVQSIRAWMYRQDVFEKHGLKSPADFNELYEVCKKLKELYPESYPLCLRSGVSNIGVFAPSWKDYMVTDMYYDYNSEKWSYGLLEPEMLEVVKFMRKMLEEGLVNPDYLTAPAKSWEELMSTDRGFITCDYVVRIDFFNSACRAEKPEYTLAAMVPPKGNTQNATNNLLKTNMDVTGIMIANTGDEKRIENAIRLIDYMYTDEAADNVWGVEGVSYEVNEDGGREFIRPNGIDIQAEYGVLLYGTFLRIDPQAAVEFAATVHGSCS